MLMSELEKMISELCPDGVALLALGKVLKIRNGKDYKAFEPGIYPVYGSGGVIARISKYIYKKPSVLIPRKGSIDKLYYLEEPFWTVDTIFYTEINTNIAIPKYVFYCLQKENLERLNTAGGVPSLTQTVLNKVEIPLPPLPVQEEIVRILDAFTELESELESELAARKKQYEYYRDYLLTFGDKERERERERESSMGSAGRNRSSSDV
jgi:type I restriction enzyme S subunit